MLLIFIALALIVIVPLGFYAGSLLYRLRVQQQNKAARLSERIANIVESIQTIAMAMEQQQCNLSEGCIRLYHLLEGLPLADKPDYKNHYSGVYALYHEVKDLPTHEARNALSKEERRSQDSHREELEAQLETRILVDVGKLKVFQANSATYL